MVAIILGLLFTLLLLIKLSGAVFPVDYKWKIYDKKNCTECFEYTGKRVVLASDLVGGQPVYISIASISDRIKGVAATVKSILDGDVLPTHIYVIISKESYMKDKGIPVSQIPKALIELTETKPVSIVYTTNIGPHRKLLPILAQYWDTQSLLITLDDDVIYHRSTIAELMKAYITSGRDSIIALRSHRIALCADTQTIKVAEYKQWPLVSYGIREMLQLPTGTGGVLYRPDFFHPIVFDKKLWSLTSTGDDITFRLATMIKDIPIVTACRVSREIGGVMACPETYSIRSPGGGDRLMNSVPTDEQEENEVRYLKKIRKYSRTLQYSKKPTVFNLLNDSDVTAVTATPPSPTGVTSAHMSRPANHMSSNHTHIYTYVAKPANSSLLQHKEGKIHGNSTSTSSSSTSSSSSSSKRTITSNIGSKQSTTMNITNIEDHKNNHKSPLSSQEKQQQQQRRQRRNLRDRTSSASSKISLWQLNRKGRNDLMWNNAVKYIETTLEINMFSIYNFYFLKERNDCLLKNKASKFKCGLSGSCFTHRDRT